MKRNWMRQASSCKNYCSKTGYRFVWKQFWNGLFYYFTKTAKRCYLRLTFLFSILYKNYAIGTLLEVFFCYSRVHFLWKNTLICSFKLFFPFCSKMRRFLRSLFSSNFLLYRILSLTSWSFAIEWICLKMINFNIGWLNA